MNSKKLDQLDSMFKNGYLIWYADSKGKVFVECFNPKENEGISNLFEEATKHLV